MTTSSRLFDNRVPELLRQAIELYRVSGRGFKNLSDADLDAQFVQAFQAYAADQRNRATSKALNDAAAEYVLRRRDAPLELVASKLSWFLEFTGYEDRLPLVLLAFGGIMCIPAFGMVLQLIGSAVDHATHADFRWFLGLSAAERPERVVSLAGARTRMAR